MTETTAAATPATPAAATPKKSKASKKKGTGAKPSHPPTSQMVNAAIATLKERGGSSVQAITKYIASNYKTDAEKLAPFIKIYLKSAVAAGTLTQTKGKGASGSFKLAGSKASSEGKPAPKKKAVASSGTTARGNKPAAASSPRKKSSAPSKAKKTTKPPTKPKTPKPKKAKLAKAPSDAKPPKPKKSPAKKSSAAKARRPTSRP